MRKTGKRESKYTQLQLLSYNIFVIDNYLTEKPRIELATSENWKDYELIDSGNGLKLERFGPYQFVRPESQAIWTPVLDAKTWHDVDAYFQLSGGLEEGHWHFNKPVDKRWQMSYNGIKFWAETTPFRHVGFFPEQANHWEWMTNLVATAGRPIKVLNLFGYTGLATVMIAKSNAQVTHVDASKKAVSWASDNLKLSGLEDRSVRWIVEDALKYVRREIKRESKYDGIILDPPKFGRGPNGEIWKIEDSLPALLKDCRSLLSDKPLFVALTTYAIRLSPLSLYNFMSEMLKGLGCKTTAGELVLIEKTAGRPLSTADFVRWEK